METIARMDQWHFDDSGQQRGPVTAEEIRSLLANCKIQPDTLVWSEGMGDSARRADHRHHLLQPSV